MSQQKVRRLLQELHDELSESGELDAETLSMARKLDQDIDRVIETGEEPDRPLMDDAVSLEARFAVQHPVAERLIRELIENLARMGI